MIAPSYDIFQDFAEFIAGLSPQKLLNYYAPPKLQDRVDYLVALKKDGKLTNEEQEELEKYFMFEHIVRLAKARALKLVANDGN